MGASWFILYSKISGELLRERANTMDFSLDLDDAIITRPVPAARLRRFFRCTREADYLKNS